VIVVALFAAAAELQAVRERWYPQPPDEQATMYLRSGDAVRRLAGAYAPLAADLYWIRAIQYYGGTKRRLNPEWNGTGVTPAEHPPISNLQSSTSNEYGLLYPMLDVTTTLDPRFNIAYRFGAIFLAEPFPSGPGRPDLAVKLLEKGLRARPDKWEYMEDIAFVHYWYEHDYRSAASWFQKASEVPGAPWWTRSMAATLLAQGGNRAASRTMWETIRQTTEIPWVRQDAERKLAQLRAADDIDALQRGVDAIAQRTGRTPASWQSLIAAGQMRGIPVDPSGVPYELTADGRVRLSQSSPLYPLLVEPPAQEPGGASPGAANPSVPRP
jgi:hypothetical protein